jgi:hypothetical protein
VFKTSGPQEKVRIFSRKAAQAAKFGQVRRYFSLRTWRSWRDQFIEVWALSAPPR